MKMRPMCPPMIPLQRDCEQLTLILIRLTIRLNQGNQTQTTANQLNQGNQTQTTANQTKSSQLLELKKKPPRANSEQLYLEEKRY
jgi:hypothetical protein